MPRRKNESKRSAKGNGSVTQRTVEKDGKKYTYWQGRISIVDPATGKRKQISFSGKSQKEVLEKLKLAQSEISAGQYVDPSKITLKEWLEIFQRDYMTDCKSGTKFTYRVAINNYIIPALGGLKLQKVSAPQLQQFVNSLVSKGLKAKTIKNYFGTLHRAMNQALKIGFIKVNPCNVVKLPRVVSKEIIALDSDGVFKLLDGIKGDRFEEPLTVCIFTGMRESELCGLQWRNIDFENCTITVDHQYLRNKFTKQMEIVPTKTCNTRIISVPPSIIELLKNVKRKQLENSIAAGELWKNDSFFVFTDETGKCISEKALYQHFKRTIKNIEDIPDDLSIHALRHSFATLSLELGTDFKTLQESLGHSQASTTLNIYSHSSDKMKREAANKMENLIAKKSKAV